MKLFNKYKSEIFILLTLVLLGVATRTFLHIGPNFELVTAITILSALKLPHRGWLVTFLIMVISDLIIGNTNIFIFTWTGFAFTYLSTSLIKYRLKQAEGLAKFVTLETWGILTVLVFFFWTNFGVVVLGHMYSHDLAGYLQSLYMALPFLKLQLQSAIIFVPILVWGYEFITQFYSYVRLNQQET